MPASHQCSKEAGAPKYKFGSLHNQPQESQPCLFTLSRANLALTLTKLVLKPKNMINMHLGWLGGVLQCVWGHSSLQPHQNGRGEAYI